METKNNNISRKHFITQVNLGFGALGAALFFPVSLSVAKENSEKTSTSKNVVVIGAGLSGLAAALELSRAGHKVKVLETRNRPGGRVSTLKTTFRNGLYAEEGAAAFSETYTLANRYIEEFELQKIPIPMPEAPVVYHLKGERFLDNNEGKTKWPYQLSHEEQRLGPMGILKKYILDSLPKQISEADAWYKHPIVKMDEKSLGSYMREQGATEGGS